MALHRVKHLLKNGMGRVLLTTFTHALADSLRESLELLVDDPVRLERVDVMVVNALAHKVVHEHRTVPRLVSDNDADARRRWQRIIKK